MTETSITTGNPAARQPVRDFRLRPAFALSFADLSPIVGIYTVFAIGLIAAGPAFLWAFPLVLIGQLFVCGVFGNLVSKWGLTLTLAVLPITAAPYILSAAGVSAPSQITVELPKAVVLSLAVGGLLVIVACLGIVLAIPDMTAAVSGKDTNPVATTLVHAYGSGAGRTLLIALAVGFTSSMIAVQTAVTRAIWASARDRMLPGNRLLGRLSGREHLPRYAIVLTIVIAGALIFAGASKVFALLVSFSAFGFILSYYLPIAALGWKQWCGQRPTSGAWGERRIRLITAIAAVWLSPEIVNLLWPRTVNSAWYLNWGSIIMTGMLGVLGGLICLRSFRPGSAAAVAARRPAAVAAESDDA